MSLKINLSANKTFVKHDKREERKRARQKASKLKAEMELVKKIQQSGVKLIIDDEEIDVYQVDRMLKKTKKAEYFYSFSDGKEALEHFKSFEESQKKFEGYFPPTIILLDINMPRMGGFEFLENLMELPEGKICQSVILMLTSSSLERDRERAQKFAIVKDYIEKPFTTDHLENIIKSIMGGPQQ